VNGVLSKVRGVYDLHGEKMRYLLVGAWNTLFSVLLFNVFLWLFGHAQYIVLFWASWVVAVVQSTVTMKYVVFRSHGQLGRQLGRAYLIYLPAQALSTGILWAAVQLVHMPVPAAQLVAIVVTTIFSYLGHKYFTFRLPLEVGEVPPQDLMEEPEADAGQSRGGQ
jgi:putative flippase GtrA